jgi:hypothetical protein
VKHAPFKSFTDPVHGFVAVRKGVLMDLLQSPEVQRLRRIRQLGVGHLVFPGAEHSRFGHALGAMAIMEKALGTLRMKGADISADEQTAALAAALLHDIGHGPFSHTLEHSLVSGFTHEMMSRRLIVRLADRFLSPVDLALAMFDNAYPRPFFHQLVSSQLDMDRLDYLRRDTYYTGVVEGAVGSDRIIRNLRVHPLDDSGGIVVDRKGLHAVENFLMARRLMYWQVYLHKAVVAGDQLLRAALRRAQTLLKRGNRAAQAASPALVFFLERDLEAADLERDDVVDHYVNLDDSDLLFSLKRWSQSDDPILRDLSDRFLTRRFPRVTYLEERPTDETVHQIRNRVLALDSLPRAVGQDDDTASYYLAVDKADHSAYERSEDGIRIVEEDGTIRELSAITDAAMVSALTRFETRWYVCVPKDVDVRDLL